MDRREESLWQAQLQAEALFDAVVARGLIRSGIDEVTLNEEIQALAQAEFGVQRHWHRRIVRSGFNTLGSFYQSTPNREIAADDVVYLDFGPVFGEWEADFGRTYVLGNDPRKHQLVSDLAEAFALGQALFERDLQLNASQLYDYVAQLAVERGWTFGNDIAGHIVDRFPHPREPARRERIVSGNSMSLREPFEDGRPRHWILEIHFVDRALDYGGFLEELLTIRGPTGDARLRELSATGQCRTGLRAYAMGGVARRFRSGFVLKPSSGESSSHDDFERQHRHYGVLP